MIETQTGFWMNPFVCHYLHISPSCHKMPQVYGGFRYICCTSDGKVPATASLHLASVWQLGDLRTVQSLFLPHNPRLSSEDLFICN